MTVSHTQMQSCNINRVIYFQYKPFPTEENLIDRLDNNFQWEEYKQSTVKDFLYRKGRISQEQSQNVEIQITGS